MAVFQAARDRCAAVLTAAGVANVTLDPVAVPPFVLVGLPEDVQSVARAGWKFVLPVHVVAPPPGGADAADWLLSQLPLVLSSLSGAAAGPDTYPVSDKDCPAYRVEHVVTITDPNPC